MGKARSGIVRRLAAGFAAGVIGEALQYGALALFRAVKGGDGPASVRAYRRRGGRLGLPIALVFGAAGGIWGACYGAASRRPGVVSGIAFGLLPMLWDGIAATRLAGARPFDGYTRRGVAVPVAGNMLIWGAVVGALCARWAIARR